MTREEAIETLIANYPDKCYESLRNAVDIAIEALKAEPKRGRWEHEKRSCGHGWYDALVCTVCYKSAVDEYRFCPNCGARMDEVEK